MLGWTLSSDDGGFSRKGLVRPISSEEGVQFYSNRRRITHSYELGQTKIRITDREE